MISKCVLSLTEHLRNPSSPEYAVLGSCTVLSTQTVLKHLTTVIFRTNWFQYISGSKIFWYAIFYFRIQKHYLLFFLGFFQGDPWFPFFFSLYILEFFDNCEAILTLPCFSFCFFSSHHESLKAQKAINEVKSLISINLRLCLWIYFWYFLVPQQLFVMYNIYFPGVSRSIFRTSDNHIDGPNFADLVSQIGSMSFDSSGLHWR